MSNYSQIIQQLDNATAQKMQFPLKISSVNVIKSLVSCDLVTFTEKILNEKVHFLFSAVIYNPDLLTMPVLDTKI